MNKIVHFEQIAALAAHNPYPAERWERAFDSPEAVAYQLNGRRMPETPDALPDEPERAVDELRELFNDEVRYVSLYLHAHFPEEFVYWRLGSLARAVFQGFDELAEAVPELEVPFFSMGRRNMDRYLELNERLVALRDRVWADQEHPSTCLQRFLTTLGVLYLDRDGQTEYWLAASDTDPDPELAESDENTVVWSTNCHADPGNLVFFYRKGGPTAMTDVFRVASRPWFDPLSAWTGFWANLEHLCSFEPIQFGTMKNDEVLGDWWVIRKHMQGSTFEAVPHGIYNRFLKLMPQDAVAQAGLESERVSETEIWGNFATENEFEDKAIEPLLKDWGFDWTREKPVRTQIGSEARTFFADFLVEDDDGPITLFEDKVAIRDESELAPAREQAFSYARLMGVPSCVVAAPEGFWLYEMDYSGGSLVAEVPGHEVQKRAGEVRKLLLEFRQ